MGRWAAGVVVSVSLLPAMAAADDLQRFAIEESLDIYAPVMFYETRPVGLIVGAVVGEESGIVGAGETKKGSGVEPDGATVFRVGSISKVFATQVLSAMVADDTVALTDTLSEYLPEDARVPDYDGTPIRLIDLATHSAGFPRELPNPPEPVEGNPLAAKTLPAYLDFLTGYELPFRPGTSAAYSNLGFELLAAGLEGAGKSPYDRLLSRYVTGPLGLADTGLRLNEDQRVRLMTAYDFEGEETNAYEGSSLVGGSGGVFTTANDLVKWLKWNLAEERDETRTLYHAVYLPRSRFDAVIALDESTRLDNMGLGWVATEPDPPMPFVLQKAGALTGFMAYVVMAPAQRKAAFFVINEFDFAADTTLTELTNVLVSGLPDGN